MKEQKNISSTNSGFTFIELLVVISIIGLLSSVTLAAVGATKDRANDSKKMIEVRSVDSALKLYSMNVSGAPGNYQGSTPGDAGFQPNGGGTMHAVEGTTAYNTSMQQLVDAKVLPSIPKSSDGTSYRYFDYGGTDGATFMAILSNKKVIVAPGTNNPVSRNMQVLSDVKAIVDAIKKINTNVVIFYYQAVASVCLINTYGPTCFKEAGIASPPLYVAISQYLPNIPVPPTTNTNSYMYGSYYVSLPLMRPSITQGQVYYGQEYDGVDTICPTNSGRIKYYNMYNDTHYQRYCDPNYP